MCYTAPPKGAIILITDTLIPVFNFLNKYLKKQADSQVIVVDWALIIDDNLLDYFDKIILLTCSNEEIYRRLDGAYWPLSEVKHRVSLQLTTDEKINKLKERKKDYIVVNTEEKISYDEIMKFIEE